MRPDASHYPTVELVKEPSDVGVCSTRPIPAELDSVPVSVPLSFAVHCVALTSAPDPRSAVSIFWWDARSNLSGSIAESCYREVCASRWFAQSDIPENRILVEHVRSAFSADSVARPTAPVPHQVVLTHRIATTSPRRFLIADEVGLGNAEEARREIASCPVRRFNAIFYVCGESRRKFYSPGGCGRAQHRPDLGGCLLPHLRCQRLDVTLKLTHRSDHVRTTA